MRVTSLVATKNKKQKRKSSKGQILKVSPSPTPTPSSPTPTHHDATIADVMTLIATNTNQHPAFITTVITHKIIKINDTNKNNHWIQGKGTDPTPLPRCSSSSSSGNLSIRCNYCVMSVLLLLLFWLLSAYIPFWPMRYVLALTGCTTGVYVHTTAVVLCPKKTGSKLLQAFEEKKAKLGSSLWYRTFPRNRFSQAGYDASIARATYIQVLIVWICSTTAGGKLSVAVFYVETGYR